MNNTDINFLVSLAKSTSDKDSSGDFTTFSKSELEEFVKLVIQNHELQLIKNYDIRKHLLGN